MGVTDSRKASTTKVVAVFAIFYAILIAATPECGAR